MISLRRSKKLLENMVSGPERQDTLNFDLGTALSYNVFAVLVFPLSSPYPPATPFIVVKSAEKFPIAFRRIFPTAPASKAFGEGPPRS
jgi:hypothetical protein